MSDHYLKFASEAAAVSAMEAAGLGIEGVVPEGPVWVNGERVDIHTVGIIYDMVGEGEKVEAIPQAGWHINIRGPLPESLEQFCAYPSTPRAIWG